MDDNIKKKISEAKEKLMMYRLMVESAHDAIFFKDLESRYIIVNDKTLEAFGLTREEVIGKNDLELMPNEEEAKKNMEDDQYVFESGEIKELIKHMTGDDGKEYWFEAIKVPQYDIDGKIKGLVGVARDITERKKMEAELEQKVREMNTFINNIPHMAWLKDVDSNYILVNKAFGDVVGMSPEDLKNHTCAVYFDLETANKFREDDLAVIEGKKQITFEETIVDISGKERYLETIKSPIFNNTGDVIGTVGIAIDITERKQMEEELRKHREEKYKLITENIFDFILIVNEAFQLEYINESITRKLGYASKELIGKSITDFIHPEEREETMLVFKKSYSEGEGQKTVKILHKEGYWVYLESRGKTFIDVNGKLKALIIARDITERKKAKDKLIEECNKAEFYKDLVVHDMSNILNNIKMSFHLQEMLKDNSEKTAKKKRMMEIIKQQLERGGSLISNVRKLSDIEEEKTLKSIDIKSILEKLIKNTCTRFQGKGIEIKSEIPQETFNVIAGDLLIDAFENVLINSTIHNDSKKKIIWVKISKFQKEGSKFVKIEFKDNGIGIIDNRKKTIFKRSYKNERTTGGMGFGLSLVEKIVSTYGGQIWVEDRVNGDHTKGSNFIVLLKES